MAQARGEQAAGHVGKAGIAGGGQGRIDDVERLGCGRARDSLGGKGRLHAACRRDGCAGLGHQLAQLGRGLHGDGRRCLDRFQIACHARVGAAALPHHVSQLVVHERDVGRLQGDAKARAQHVEGAAHIALEHIGAPEHPIAHGARRPHGHGGAAVAQRLVGAPERTLQQVRDLQVAQVERVGHHTHALSGVDHGIGDRDAFGCRIGCRPLTRVDGIAINRYRLRCTRNVVQHPGAVAVERAVHLLGAVGEAVEQLSLGDGAGKRLHGRCGIGLGKRMRASERHQATVLA